MKHLLLPILLLLAYSTNAQYQYVPMPIDSASWRFLKVDAYYHRPYGNQFCNRYNIIYTVTGKDTTILGKTYKIIISRTASRNPFYDTTCSFPDADTLMATEPDKFAYAIREENKKVYLFGPRQTIEYQVFDFNASIGDAIAGFSDTNKIKAIDTVLIRNTLRKRYFLANDTIIEGIGSLRRGLDPQFNHPYIPALQPHKNVLTCFLYNDTTYYSNPDFRCFYLHNAFPTSVNNESFYNQQVVYPNPFTDKLNITVDKQCKAVLYNSVGIVVATYNVEKNTTVTTPGLPDGLYLLVLKDNAGSIMHIKKLLKQ